jgi:hypothetical protein
MSLLAVFIMAECLKERPDFNNIRLELASPSLPQTLERMAESDVLPVRVAAGRLFRARHAGNRDTPMM